MRSVVGTGSSVFRTAFTASADCAYAESVGVTMRARRFLCRPGRHRIDRSTYIVTQILVYSLHACRAFANRRRDTFDRA